MIVIDLGRAVDAVKLAIEATATASARIDVFDGDTTAVTLDSDGKAHPYAVIYAGPGSERPDSRALCGSSGHLSWTFQVTAAGGDLPRCRRAIHRVLSALIDARVTIGDASTGPIRMEGSPGQPLIDASVPPARHYLPLLFTCEI